MTLTLLKIDCTIWATDRGEKIMLFTETDRKENLNKPNNIPQKPGSSRQKKVAVINDLSGFGRCALTVMLPIIS